jgi:hypothetical protein
MLRLFLSSLLVAACCCAEPDASLQPSPWARFLGREAVAMAHKRTREELDNFVRRCAELEPYWEGVVKHHESRARVVVLDVRHNWNGLGDTHERLNFLLRVGRGLQRATYLWLDSTADPGGPERQHSGERMVRNHSEQAFDPGQFVQGLGNVHWRWTAAERRAVVTSHPPGQKWVSLRYECKNIIADGMCGEVELQDADSGAVAFSVANGSGLEVARGVFAYLNDTLRDAPLLRLELTTQGQLTMESRLPGVCPIPMEHCPQNCESFLNWRPRASLWGHLRPHLTVMDKWAGVVGLTVRTGAADHFGALYSALQPNASRTQDRDSLISRTEALFWPCQPGVPNFNRNRLPEETPCVNWVSDRAGRPTPTVELAQSCSGHASAARTQRLFPDSSGSLGAFVECAARVAAAVAADRGQPDAWGVAIFTDAPGLKCLLEESSLGASGRVLVTPSAPGHVQYAPSGAVLDQVSRMTLVDWMLAGLCDWQVPALGSAFGGSSVVRSMHDRHLPAGSQAVENFDRGFERWFTVGRENEQGQGVDTELLATLGETHPQCPVTQRSVAEMLALYTQAGPQGLLIKG